MLYRQRGDIEERVSIFDAFDGRPVEFTGYVPIWRSIDRSHQLEAWGDPGYRAPTADDAGGGTFSLLVRMSRGYHLICSGLPLSYLWTLREAAAGLLPEEDSAAFGRWAVRRLRAEQLCAVADWPGAVPLDQLLRPAA